MAITCPKCHATYTSDACGLDAATLHTATVVCACGCQMEITAPKHGRKLFSWFKMAEATLNVQERETPRLEAP